MSSDGYAPETDTTDPSAPTTMPTFLFRATIDPEQRELRNVLRGAHLAYQATFDNLAGGPLTDDDGNVTGTIIIFDAVDRAAAEARILADPFVERRVVGEWTLDVFNPIDWPT